MGTNLSYYKQIMEQKLSKAVSDLLSCIQNTQSLQSRLNKRKFFIEIQKIWKNAGAIQEPINQNRKKSITSKILEKFGREFEDKEHNIVIPRQTKEQFRGLVFHSEWFGGKKSSSQYLEEEFDQDEEEFQMRSLVQQKQSRSVQVQVSTKKPFSICTLLQLQYHFIQTNRRDLKKEEINFEKFQWETYAQKILEDIFTEANAKLNKNVFDKSLIKSDLSILVNQEKGQVLKAVNALLPVNSEAKSTCFHFVRCIKTIRNMMVHHDNLKQASFFKYAWEHLYLVIKILGINSQSRQFINSRRKQMHVRSARKMLRYK